MAQIVIFAPEGEDVSAGEQALKDAGHDVEVVEATAENLLHMAIGMIGDSEPKPKDEPKEEDPLETPAEEPPAEEPAEAEDEPEVKAESLEMCVIEGDKVAFRRGTKTRLFVSELQRGEKTTFRLTESQIAIWGPRFNFVATTPKGTYHGVSAPVYRSKYGKTYLEVGPELRAHF